MERTGHTEAPLTVPEAARELGRSPATVYRAMAAGHLAWVNIGRRRLIDPANLRRLRDRHTRKERTQHARPEDSTG